MKQTGKEQMRRMKERPMQGRASSGSRARTQCRGEAEAGSQAGSLHKRK